MSTLTVRPMIRSRPRCPDVGQCTLMNNLAELVARQLEKESEGMTPLARRLSDGSKGRKEVVSARVQHRWPGQAALVRVGLQTAIGFEGAPRGRGGGRSERIASSYFLIKLFSYRERFLCAKTVSLPPLAFSQTSAYTAVWSDHLNVLHLSIPAQRLHFHTCPMADSHYAGICAPPAGAAPE